MNSRLPKVKQQQKLQSNTSKNAIALFQKLTQSCHRIDNESECDRLPTQPPTPKDTIPKNTSATTINEINTSRIAIMINPAIALPQKAIA